MEFPFDKRNGDLLVFNSSNTEEPLMIVSPDGTHISLENSVHTPACFTSAIHQARVCGNTIS